jgi:hypothetical protein
MSEEGSKDSALSETGVQTESQSQTPSRSQSRERRRRYGERSERALTVLGKGYVGGVVGSSDHGKKGEIKRRREEQRG